MGVASLLFHRTLDPKDTLQVKSYTLVKQQPHTQLQVHSYAREHQSRHLQHKTCTPSVAQGQPSPQAPGCERIEPQPESKMILLTKAAVNESEALGLVELDQKEEKPEVSITAEPLAELKPTIKTVSSLPLTQLKELSKKEIEAPKNKRKVCLFVISLWYSLEHAFNRKRQAFHSWLSVRTYV